MSAQIDRSRHVTSPDADAEAAAETDAELAIRLAVQAGRGLVDLRQRMTAEGAHTWQVMDGGDTASQRFLADELRRLRPDDAVLSEEGLEDPRRFDDRPGVDHRPARRHARVRRAGPQRLGRARRAVGRRRASLAGAVSLPGDRRRRSPPTRRPSLPPRRPRAADASSRRASRAPYAAAVVAHALDAEAVRLGSAGAKAMSVVNGETDIYVHDGGMYQWDSAAPAAVALAAGLHVSRIDGSPLVYNDRDPWLPDFIVCRQEWAEPRPRRALGS